MRKAVKIVSRVMAVLYIKRNEALFCPWGCSLRRFILRFVQHNFPSLPLVMCTLLTEEFCILYHFLVCKFQSFPNKVNFLPASFCHFYALIWLPEWIQTRTCRRVALGHLFANWRGLNCQVQWMVPKFVIIQSVSLYICEIVPSTKINIHGALAKLLCDAK